MCFALKSTVKEESYTPLVLMQESWLCKSILWVSNGCSYPCLEANRTISKACCCLMSPTWFQQESTLTYASINSKMVPLETSMVKTQSNSALKQSYAMCLHSPKNLQSSIQSHLCSLRTQTTCNWTSTRKTLVRKSLQSRRAGTMELRVLLSMASTSLTLTANRRTFSLLTQSN